MGQKLTKLIVVQGGCGAAATMRNAAQAHDAAALATHADFPRVRESLTGSCRGMNELEAMAFDRNGKRGPRLLLAREGFASWRLVGIELPPARD